MSGMAKGKSIVSAITVSISLLVVIHINGDQGLGWGFEGTAKLAAYWLFVPILAFIVGVSARKTRRLQQALATSIYYLLFMLFCVLMTPSEDKMGAEHFHMLVVPITMVSFLPVVLCTQWSMWRFRDWRDKKNETGGENRDSHL